MGAEDFPDEKPRCNILVGNGENAANLRNPHYDFNDKVLPLGASYWVRLV
jgi:hypothetical protein